VFDEVGLFGAVPSSFVTDLQPVPWGDGTPIPGTPFRIVVSAESTDGHAVGIAVDMPPGVHVDEHTHADEDQICIVLSGTLGCRVGGIDSMLEAGAILVVPRLIPHELWNAATISFDWSSSTHRLEWRSTSRSPEPRHSVKVATEQATSTTPPIHEPAKLIRCGVQLQHRFAWPASSARPR
jgi:quercetin dioxygenase-like cupin family protein